MQLARIAAALAILVGGAAHAEDAFTAKTQVYVDSDHTTVISPLVALSRDTWKGGTLSASYVADVVSSASVDVVSNATKHMDDFRSEITAGLTQKLSATTLSASYIYSIEHDYESHNVALGLAQDLLQRNTTLSVGWTLSESNVGRAGDQGFHRSLLVTGVAASWTQALTPKTIAQLSYNFSYNSGFQASPYRFVPVWGPDTELASYKVPETDPTLRLRHAIVVGLNRHLFHDTALQGDYRFYVDSWGVTAHTVQLRYLVSWRDVTLRIRERFYIQKGAEFFQTRYTEPQEFMTADRELSSFWSNIVGLKVAWRLPWVHRALELEAKGDFFYFHYDDFALLASRVGGTAELGLNVVY